MIKRAKDKKVQKLNGGILKNNTSGIKALIKIGYQFTKERYFGDSFIAKDPIKRNFYQRQKTLKVHKSTNDIGIAKQLVSLEPLMQTEPELLMHQLTLFKGEELVGFC